jgi:hypothetical protein
MSEASPPPASIVEDYDAIRQATEQLRKTESAPLNLPPVRDPLADIRARVRQLFGPPIWQEPR